MRGQKIIILFLILSLILPSALVLYPQRAEATIAVIDWVKNAWDKAQTYLWEYLKKAARAAAKELLLQMIQETVRWIDSGFQGNPAFMTNPEQFLENTADQAIGDFIFNNPALNFLCEPFQLKIKISLGLTYRPYYKEIQCTLSDVLNNVGGAYDNFISGNVIEGGWDDWIQLTTVPQNTPQGSYFGTKLEMDARIDANKDIPLREAGWGDGALSLKKCETKNYQTGQDESGNMTRTQIGGESTFIGHPGYSSGTSTAVTDGIDEDNYVSSETVCNTTTPGKIFVDQLSLSQTSWIRTTELSATLADGIDAIIAALGNQLVSVTLKKLKDGILDVDDSSNTSDYSAQLAAQVAAAQAQYQNSASAYNNEVSAARDGTGNVNQADGTGNSSLLARIESLIASETEYKDIFYNIYSSLGLAKTEFTSARNCTANYNDTASVIRTTVLTNITKNIDGSNNSSEVVSNPIGNPSLIPTNLILAGLEMSSSTSIINGLNTTKNTLSSLSAAERQTVSQNLNNYPFHSTSTAYSIRTSLIKWLNNVDTSYSSTTCPVNESVWQ